MSRTNEHGYVGAKPLTSKSKNTGVFTPTEQNILNEQGKLAKPGDTAMIDLIVVAGGGGGGCQNGSANGSNGGSGSVLLKVANSDLPVSTTGTVEVHTVGDNTTYWFKSTGSITF